MEKGCLVRFTTIINDQISNHYEYCPIHSGNEKCYEWANNMISTRQNDHPAIIYWWLKQYSCVPVMRNKEWFEGHLPTIDKFWKKVLYYRANPIEAKQDLEPKRKKVNAMPKYSNCVLDSDSDSESESESD